MLTLFGRVLLAGLCLALVGCSDDPVPVVAKKKAKKVRLQKPLVEKVAEKIEPPLNVFNYSPIGQRDPFESLLKKEKESQEAKAPKTPLEKFDLGQFRVQAILIGKGAPRAMVSAPDGKNYILKPGLKIGKNNGVIRDIVKEAIIVEESTFDAAGAVVKELQSIKISEQETL